MIFDKLTQLETRQIYLLVGSGLFLIVTAMIFIGAKPTYERYAETQGELENLRELDSGATDAALQPLEKEVARYRAELMGQLQNIPIRELESHIIGALQNSAWQTEIDLLSIEPLESSSGLPYQEIAFRLELQGQYSNLDEWIRNVSQHLGYVVFKEYAVKVVQEGADPILGARILLAAYRVEGAA